MSQPVIGIIGLGLMGAGLSKRLAAQGYRVAGVDVVPDKVAAARAWGVEPCGKAADLAAIADFVLVSVTRPADLEATVTGHNGLLSAGPGRRTRVLVDLSTTDIATTKRVADALAAAEIGFVDAPVSGGPGAAETGSLAIMAGGASEAIDAVAPIMQRLGRFTPMGGVGAGQATKLVNQALVLTNYCVIAEAVRLAEAHGIDVARLPEALGSGHAGSNLLPVLVERMVARDFAPRGYARQVLKDLEMLNDAAHEKGLALPMAGQALTLYRLLAAAGKSELDGAAILTVWPDPKA